MLIKLYANAQAVAHHIIENKILVAGFAPDSHNTTEIIINTGEYNIEQSSIAPQYFIVSVKESKKEVLLNG